MKINLPIVTGTKTIGEYRKCQICADGIKADKSVTIATGYNASITIAYCQNHYEQFKNDAKGME